MSSGSGAVRTPLDLRLLPAVLACWAAAWCSVHLDAGPALLLGAALLGCAVLVGCVLLRDTASLSSGAFRAATRPAALHVMLCLAVAGAVMLSAGQTMHRYEASGWKDLVSSEAPEEMVWRVLEDPRPVSRPDFDGSSRVIAEVEVLHAQSTGTVRAPALLLMSSDEETTFTVSGAAPPRAGHRYRATMSSSPTPSGDDATALLTPFGDSPHERLAPDRRTAFAETFTTLREGTRDASQTAWGDGAALLPSMILGDRSRQSRELTEAMEDSGLSHLSAISGTHCSLILGALMGMARLCRAPRWTIVPLVLTGLTVFVMLVHPTPSVIRAAVMGGIGALAVFAGRGRTSSALLCTCVLLLLLHNPWYAMDAAFR